MVLASIPTVLDLLFLFFVFNDPAATEIYTLSLHDALPISPFARGAGGSVGEVKFCAISLSRCRSESPTPSKTDRKSTRLNSSHVSISYAVFCLKKKKRTQIPSRDIKRTESTAAELHGQLKR